MSDRVTVEVSGDREIIAALKQMGDEAEKVLEEATRAGAELIRDEIERRAPEDQGDLRSGGFTVKRGSMKRDAANAVVTLAQRLYEYAFYLEFGAKGKLKGGGPRTRGGVLPARPFIRKAFLAKKKDAADAVERALRRVLGD